VSLLFESPLFIIPVSTGLIFIIVGLVMHKFPPKGINALYGYRSVNSMKNEEQWHFSQKYAALEMIKLGVGLSFSGILGLLFNLSEKTGMLLGLGLMILMVVLLIYRVEKAIKATFNNHKK
jgi:uncharacterized membrane protein